MIVYYIHDTTEVTSDVTLTNKIELEFEQNKDKTDGETLKP